MYRLCTDDLAGGRDQRRIAHILAHPRRLQQRFIEFIQSVERFELTEQVGEHAAGDLIGQALGIRGHRNGVESTVSQKSGADRLKEIRHFQQSFVVEIRVVAQLAKGVVQRLGSGLAGTAGER